MKTLVKMIYFLLVFIPIIFILTIVDNYLLDLIISDYSHITKGVYWFEVEFVVISTYAYLVGFAASIVLYILTRVSDDETIVRASGALIRVYGITLIGFYLIYKLIISIVKK